MPNALLNVNTPAANSDTAVTPIQTLSSEHVLAMDDLLLEDSGLLQFEPAQGAQAVPEAIPEDPAEISSSFLVEDVDDGWANEVPPEYLDNIALEGEFAVPQQAPPELSGGASIRVADLHEIASDGIPATALQDEGPMAQTLRIHEDVMQRSPWLARIAIGLVFTAGIVAGLAATGMFSNEEATTAEVETTTEVAAVAPAVAATKPAVAMIENGEPAIAPLDEEEAAEALAEAPAEEEVIVEEEVIAEDEVITEDEMVAEEAITEDEVVAEEEVAQEEAMLEEAVAEEELNSDIAELVAAETAKTQRPSPTKVRRARKARTSKRLPATGTADPGVLMIGAKPPCKIRIDGKNTGLVTPQRSLKLKPGNHRITLVNREHKIRTSFKVAIRSGKKTKVIRDLTSKLK